MDKKLIVAAGGVLGVVAIAYLLSQNSGAKTGGVISAGMWGFPTSGYTAPADPAPPVNIDFPGVEIPPMQPPVVNYPEVEPVRYDYYYSGSSGGGSTKKQTVYSSSQSSTFGGSSGFGGGGVGGRSGDAPTTATFGGSSGFGGGGVGGRSGDAPTTAKKTSTGPSMGGFGVSHSAPSSGGTTSAASSIGGALSSIGKAFGW
jgi:hypothetical protein